MKKVILVISLFVICSLSKAQETDSLSIGSDIPENIDEEDSQEPAFEKKQEQQQSIIDSSDDRVRYLDSREPGRNRHREDDDVRYYQSSFKKTGKRRSRTDVKTLTGGMSHSGGFGAITFKSTEYRGENMVLVGARGGWIINRTLAIGIEGHGIVPTTKYTDLNPLVGEDATVLGGYGGIFLEPIFFSNEVVHITFPVSAGAGWMGYDEGSESIGSGNEELISDDVYWYAEPGVALEVNIARNFRLGFGVSKRFTQDLKLYNTEEDDFNTVNYFLTLKIGSF